MFGRASSSLALILVAAVLPSCSGGNDNPALTEVAKQYSQAYCEALEVCMGATDFNAVYVGGQDDCADRTLTISGTSEKSICTQEQWDKCTSELRSQKREDCVGTSDGGAGDGGTADGGIDAPRPKIPDSCQGC